MSVIRSALRVWDLTVRDKMHAESSRLLMAIKILLMPLPPISGGVMGATGVDFLGLAMIVCSLIKGLETVIVQSITVAVRPGVNAV